MITFIDQYRDRFGVEFICRALAKHRLGGFMTARAYRAARCRPICARRVRDSELIPVMMDIHQDNYSVYGVRKMWHAMRRKGHDIGRDQVARLMREADLKGLNPRWKTYHYQARKNRRCSS